MARESKEEYYKKLKIYNQIIREEKRQPVSGESSKSVNQENNKKEEANKKVATTTKHVSFKDDQNMENDSDKEIEEASEEY